MLTDRWSLVFIGVMAVGAFVWWFAPAGLYSCDDDGIRQCYLAEDAFEVGVARAASTIGAVVTLAAGVALLGRRLLILRR